MKFGPGLKYEDPKLNLSYFGLIFYIANSYLLNTICTAVS